MDEKKNMSSKKYDQIETVGYFIAIIMAVVLVVCWFDLRVCNQEKTETQLMLDYWGLWLFFTVVIGVGGGLIRYGYDKRRNTKWMN